MDEKMHSTKIKTKMKAVGLLSGGLDSTLAVRLMLEQGIEVYALNFTSPFCTCTPKKAGCAAAVTAVKKLGGIALKRVSLGDEYLKMMRNPKHGYGSEMNPCIDCRIIKLRKAAEYMRKIDASFLVTGEVLGQRPMSQHRAALKIIERESGLEGLILRPLSAKLLSPSIPEREGWVDREKLLEISGRSRKPQMALAAKYRIVDYPCPAGGCLLTDPGFARRVKDLMTHSEINLNDIELLKLGRHFRLMPQAKLVVGRNKEENERLLRLTKRDDICFRPVEVMGPIGIGRGDFEQTSITLASQIMARYSDNSQEEKIKISIEDPSQKEVNLIIANSISDNQLKVFRI
jgi:tRNA U34 2-thiouridine synthase MnmA/TrmU